MNAFTQTRNAYPSTRVDSAADELHGVRVPDPYRWLEDAKSPETQAWMQAQDALARERLRTLPEREALAARLRELSYVDALGAPLHRGNRWFHRRRHADREKAVIYVRDGKQGAERVLFDPNAWSKDGSTALGHWQPSWDGRKVAYTVRENNSDEATLHVLDVDTMQVSQVDVIPGAKYADASWTPGGEGFYYTWLPTDPSIPTADRPGYAEIRFHRLGEDPSKDRVVVPRTGDPKLFVGGSVSRDGRWLLVTVQHGWTSMDLSFRDLQQPDPGKGPLPLRPLVVGRPAHYEAQAFAGYFYVLSDEGAPRGRLFRVDPAQPERERWTELVPEHPEATLTSFGVIGGHLVLNYLQKASSRLMVHRLDGSLLREVALPGLGTVSGPVGNEDEDEAYFGFESFTSPPQVQETSIASGDTRLYSQVKVPIDPTPFVVEQRFYPSRDGTQVSMFVVRRRDLPRDGSARAILYGYGGFQVSLTPAFAPHIYPWLERGGVYVVANLRGGAEYGEDWHRAGMLLRKQNVFDDFIAAAEHLVKEGYTRPERLVISGGSNGGLLVGAALTQRPDLFAAGVCAVPLLDMVRYHLFGSGKTWIQEYGSAEDPEQFRVLHAYSPYHRVQQGTRYPSLLMLSADADDRVDPLHARKFVASLQAASSGGPVLLRIEHHSGHGGADMVRAEVEKNADRYAFALAATATP